jgi:hypothetical protein
VSYRSWCAVRSWDTTRECDARPTVTDVGKLGPPTTSEERLRPSLHKKSSASPRLRISGEENMESLDDGGAVSSTCLARRGEAVCAEWADGECERWDPTLWASVARSADRCGFRERGRAVSWGERPSEGTGGRAVSWGERPSEETGAAVEPLNVARRGAAGGTGSDGLPPTVARRGGGDGAVLASSSSRVIGGSLEVPGE